MKWEQLIKLHAGAISNCTSVLNIVRDSIGSRGKPKNAILVGDRYCGLSSAFGLVRDLYDHYPEDKKTDEMAFLMRDFYIHLHEVGDTGRFNLYAAKKAAHKAFMIIHAALRETRDD